MGGSMSFSAIIPVEHMEAANVALEAQGFGPGNFSVPLRTGTEPDASHAGLNCLADAPAFQAAVEAIPNVSMRGAPVGAVEFEQHVQSQALEWSDPTNWTENPVMAGDERTFDGKTWVSLVDFNVWTPPVNWREVPTTGYPAWVQPTGATDAYPVGFRVAHKDQNWESNTAANVWEPGVFGWDAL
jgi:hypothetical protein